MNWLDIIIAAPLILVFIKGYRTGLVMQIATFIGLTFSIIFAGKASEILAPYCAKIIDTSSHFASPILYITSFVLIMLAFVLLGKTVESLFKVVQLNFVNRLAGALTSAITWIIVASVLLVLVIKIDERQVLLKEHTRQSSNLLEPMVYIGETLVPFLKTNSAALLTIEY